MSHMSAADDASDDGWNSVLSAGQYFSPRKRRNTATVRPFEIPRLEERGREERWSDPLTTSFPKQAQLIAATDRVRQSAGSRNDIHTILDRIEDAHMRGDYMRALNEAKTLFGTTSQAAVGPQDPAAPGVPDKVDSRRPQADAPEESPNVVDNADKANMTIHDTRPGEGEREDPERADKETRTDETLESTFQARLLSKLQKTKTEQASKEVVQDLLDTLEKDANVIDDNIKKLKRHANSKMAMWPVLDITSSSSTTLSFVSSIVGSEATARTNKVSPRIVPKSCYAGSLAREANSTCAPLWYPGMASSRGPGLSAALRAAQNLCTSVIMSRVRKNRQEVLVYLTGTVKQYDPGLPLDSRLVLTSAGVDITTVASAIRKEIRIFLGESAPKEYIDQAFSYLFGFEDVFERAKHYEQLEEHVLSAADTFLVKVAEENGDTLDPFAFWFFHAAANEGIEKADAWPTWETRGLEPELARNLRNAVAKHVSSAVLRAGKIYARELEVFLKAARCPGTFDNPTLSNTFTAIASHAMYERTLLQSNFVSDYLKKVARADQAKVSFFAALNRIADNFDRYGVPKHSRDIAQ